MVEIYRIFKNRRQIRIQHQKLSTRRYFHVLNSIQNQIVHVLKPTDSELWTIKKVTWSAKNRVTISQEVLIVEKSFCTQFFIRKKRILGIFHDVFHQYRWKISQNRVKKSVFGAENGISKNAIFSRKNRVITFCLVYWSIFNILAKKIFWG